MAEAIAGLRDSGVPVHAYADTVGEQELLIGSAASRFVLAPSAMTLIKGKLLEGNKGCVIHTIRMRSWKVVAAQLTASLPLASTGTRLRHGCQSSLLC